jgi:adenosine deaminase
VGAAIVGALPKVLLHDHLDGGLRPATIIALAAGIGHDLPAEDPVALGRWFVEAASAGSLERYLETFEHTLAVMQTRDALARVAREAVLDLAGDAVVYAELRFAPELHQRAGLDLDQVVDAVLAGIDEGTAEACGRGQTIRAGLILDAMRQADHSEKIARLALAKRARVAGFDIAGPEAGHPVLHHMPAFTLLHEASFPITIHAGEADGLASMWQAVTKGQARRIGHGVAIVQDIAGLGLPGSPAGPNDEAGMSGGMRAAHIPAGVGASSGAERSAVGGRTGALGAGSGAVGGEFAELGVLAHWIRDWGIVLEMCPSSNVQTGAADSIAAHPITPLKHLGFPVTVNTDNRLMSGTSATREATLLMAEAGWTLTDLRDATVTAIGGAFIHADERTTLVDDVILPAYAAALGIG